MKRDRKVETGTGYVTDGNCSNLLNDIVPRGHVIDMLLSFAEIIAGYGLGIYIGFVVGAIIGQYIAGIHAEDLRHTIDFFDPDQLKHWNELYWVYGRTGAKIGAFASMPLMRIIQSMFFKSEVASLCNGKIADPVTIARVLGRSLRRIKKTMNRLARKGIIEYPVTIPASPIDFTFQNRNGFRWRAPTTELQPKHSLSPNFEKVLIP